MSLSLDDDLRCFVPSGRKSGQQGLGASRLPVFSPQEKSYIKGTCDFLGLGHFTTRYVTLKNYPSGLGDSYFADRDLAELVDPQWPDPGSEWLYSVPWGFRRLLNFVKVHNTTISARRCGISERTNLSFHVSVPDSVWKPHDLRDRKRRVGENALHRPV